MVCISEYCSGHNAMHIQTDFDARFDDSVGQFPDQVAALIRNVLVQSGCLQKDQVKQILPVLALDTEGLMNALLPVAAALSVAPVSNFRVGAVAEGGSGNLYLGANLEFLQHPVKVTVHAEQCAVTNAWHQGETRLKRLFVNEAPCGHCRQFLKELNAADKMQIVIHRSSQDDIIHCSIDDLLPEAFGPADLGIDDYLMSEVNYPLALEDSSELAQAALEAAKKSHAPVSQSRAGVALQLSSGRIVSGRYGENAAFNPGISAMESALVNWRMAQLGSPDDSIVAATMVEQKGKSSQRYLADAFLADYGINLEYFVV